MKRTILLWVAFVAAVLPPWLMWIDLNAMALRFVLLRGHWPMCDSALPCVSRFWYDSDSIDTVAHDPVYMALDPATWHWHLVLWSAPVWIVLRLAFGKHLPPLARRVFLIAFLLGWVCLVFDPTQAVTWHRD